MKQYIFVGLLMDFVEINTSKGAGEVTWSCSKRFRNWSIPERFAISGWPTEMASFGRYNLIYGWNGSGKTTISRLFQALEMRKSVEFNVDLSIDGMNVNGSDFEQINTPGGVFNRDFVLENVFPADGGDMALILVLGKDNVQKQQAIERLKESHAAAEAALQEARLAKAAATKALDQHCIDRAMAIEAILRSSASSRYSNV